MAPQPPFDPDPFQRIEHPFVKTERLPDGTFLALDRDGLRWVLDPKISKWWRPEGWEPPQPPALAQEPVDSGLQ